MLPLFQYPTTVVIIDDDKKLLEHLRLLLEKKVARYKFFNTPEDAISFLSNQQLKFSFPEEVFSKKETYKLQEEDFILKHDNIKKFYQDSEKYEQVTIIISDYSMPNLNGLQLLSRYKNFRLKKVLLTGDADEKIAVKAFNNGIINRFIKKDTEALLENLNSEIINLQRDYFISITNEIKHPEFNSLLKENKALENYFYQTLAKNNIVEFYLIDESGTYMTVDKEGKLGTLFIRDEDQMQALQDELLGDGGMTEECRDEIVRRKKMLAYIPEDKGLIPADEDAEKYLIPCETIEGESPLYVAFFGNFFKA